MANNVIKRVWNQNRMVAIEDLKGMTFQAESGGHTFQISGVDDAGNTVALTGSVAGVFLRPDNTDVAITGSASGGVVSVTLPANCYDVPGRFGLTVFVTANGQKTAVYAAMGTVSRTSSGTVAPGTTSDVVDLINRINAAVATIPASWTGLMADIAPTYSDAAVYPVGAYVYYNGDLYRCTTAITTAESWTAGHWTQAVLGNDVSDLKSAINVNLGNEPISLYKGHYINTNQEVGETVDYSNPIATISGMNCAVVDCVEGDKFSFVGSGGNNARLWAFIDSEDKMLSNASAGQSTDGLVISAPENASKCIINIIGNAYRGSIIKESLDDINTAIGLKANQTEVDDLNTVIRHDVSLFTGNERIAYNEDGKYIDLSGQTANISTPYNSSAFQYVVVPCQEGDQFVINAVGGISPRAYGFIGAVDGSGNGDVLYATAAGAEVLNQLVTAPQNAAYLVINSKIEFGYVSYKGMFLTDIVQNNNTAINTGKGFINDITGVVWYDNWSSIGYCIYLDQSTADISTPSLSQGGRYLVCAAEEGDRITITVTGGNKARAYGFLAQNGTVLEVADPYSTLTDFVMTAPQNTAWLVVNDLSANGKVFKGVPTYEQNDIEQGTEKIYFTVKRFIDTSGTTVDITSKIQHEHYDCAVVECNEGDQILLNGVGGITPRLWCFVDNSTPAKVISASESNAYEFGKMIVAPQGSHYVIINRISSYIGAFYKYARHPVVYESVYKNFSQNINLSTLHDMCWEYQNWVFPQCISLSNARDQLFFGFVTCDKPQNYTGVAAYDFATKQITKTLLKLNDETDDHNLLSVLPLSDGYIMCAYSDGHNTGNHIFIRKSTEKESIDRFNDAVVVGFQYATSYSQIFEYDGKIYLFTREIVNSSSVLWRWAYRISEDYGETWGAEQSFITADMQYYIQLTETNTAGKLLLLCYSNPSYEGTDIRVGYLHLDDMTLYQSNDSTLIGSTAIDYHNIGIAVSPSSGKKLRLYNGAKTDVGDVKFLYCEFTNSGSISDGIYRVYDNGETHDIVAAGTGLWIPKTQLGVAWIGTSQIAVARGYEGKDILEIYDYDSTTGVSTLNREIDSIVRQNYIRIARPMVDVNNRAIIYWKGYFNPNVYTDFVSDGRLYELS